MENLLSGGFPRALYQKEKTAWEFMGQNVPERYLDCIRSLSDGRRRAEASSSPAPAEVFDVDAETSTMNNAETQAVRIISKNPWHLWQAGVLTLRNAKGTSRQCFWGGCDCSS